MKHMLRDKLARHLDFLREDDKMIRKEGVETLSAPDLHEACEARGISTYDQTDDHLRLLLLQSIRLNLLVDPRPIPPVMVYTTRIFLLNSKVRM
ncbi:hypothetical protein IWQ62_004917 [Dispira parvispora]|uniref:Letm1 RBD domain-containing protein n=1 Tax=Dispira parvispora TaxID=1520584 RepID=A0A9W8AKQ4_9FUNG|nr:hypothetical protein IWQ62_004917 [Dispira parvispora]